jgi:hypothetical protein
MMLDVIGTAILWVCVLINIWLVKKASDSNRRAIVYFEAAIRAHESALQNEKFVRWLQSSPLWKASEKSIEVIEEKGCRQMNITLLQYHRPGDENHLNLYAELHRGEMKHPDTGEWINSVTYKSCENGKVYTRADDATFKERYIIIANFQFP